MAFIGQETDISLGAGNAAPPAQQELRQGQAAAPSGFYESFIGQGFLFAKPLPADAFESFLRTRMTAAINLGGD